MAAITLTEATERLYAVSAVLAQFRGAPTPTGRRAATDDRPAPPDVLAVVRDDLARFRRGEWRRHPLAAGMAEAAARARGDALHLAATEGGFWQPRRGESGELVPRFADLARLPVSPVERSAVLTASALTAEHVTARFVDEAMPTATAKQAARLRGQVGRYGKHRAAVLDLLPESFDAWWPGVVAELESAQRPEVPAFPTVTAVPPAVAYAALGATPERPAERGGLGVLNAPE